ncbi:MAG: two pore domain potassium channel family protein [Candidatus Diapherotrites archaeon]|nr:two pore domain potassium channel family protein [Candidatus Diapherotrites archaeon]
MNWTAKKIQILSLAMAILFLIFVGTAFYNLHEGFTLIDSFYLAVSTLSTVGFGDVHPVTEIGKLFTAFYILFGVAVFLYSVGAIAALYVKSEQKAIIGVMEKKLHAKLEEHLGKKAK